MAFLKSIRGAFFLYGTFVALCAGWILISTLTSPSEQQRAILLGLSLPRLILALGLLLALMLFGSLTLISIKNPAWIDRLARHWAGGTTQSRGLALLSAISLSLSWIGVFLPAYRMGSWVNYWLRLQPMLVFLLLASLATLIVLYRLQTQSLDTAAFKLVLPVFALTVLFISFMFFSGFGVVSATEDFWYGPGMPVLGTQISLILLSGALFLQFAKQWSTLRADILICTSLFIITAFLWARAPLQESFLFTGPMFPSFVYYPFADAANFDIGSQFALIGQKIFAYNTLFFERPLYLSYLVYLHTLFGQNYETLMTVQAVLFAILPVLIYLIGRSLDVPVVGFAAALTVMLRGLNSIAASNLIDSSGPKMMLTDFPTALGLAWITLLVCEWLREPEQKRHYPLWIGGAIGFTLMLRTNALILLVLLPVYTLFFFKTKWKPWLVSSSLIVLGLIAITLPWELRNQFNGGQMYGPIVGKFQAVIQTRYPNLFNPESSQPQDELLPSSARLMNTQALMSLYKEHQPNLQDAATCDTVICFSTNHFLHNFLASILIIPTSPMLDDLRTLTKETHLYWRADWNGRLHEAEPYLLIINVFFITTGITVAWRQKKLVGLTPLAIFFIYNLSNALARTSGGRYVVPADWIIPIYYLLGLFYSLIWLAQGVGRKWQLVQPKPLRSTVKPMPILNFMWAVFGLLALGGLLPLSESLFRPRFENRIPEEILSENQVLVEAAGLNLFELNEFLELPGAEISIGRILYPRYYSIGYGEMRDSFYPFQIMDFPRTTFKLIGPAGEKSVILPGEVPANLEHINDVIVLGCNMPNYFDALVVIELDEDPVVYARSPESPLQCPLAQPVCNNNSVCQ